MIIRVASRRSSLAQAQVWEVLREIRQFHPYVSFDCQLINSQGDLDQKTSLRNLDKSDFFTKEIDELVLSQECRIAIHSAKDLPANIYHNLSLVALTQGLDSYDSLVMRQGVTIGSMLPNSLIATSSLRREEAVKLLRPDFCFMDLRGSITERLALLERKEADGVVVAEAALIRLGLTNLNRIRLPGDTVEFQGKLAIIARKNDLDIKALFSSIDCRESK